MIVNHSVASRTIAAAAAPPPSLKMCTSTVIVPLCLFAAFLSRSLAIEDARHPLPMLTKLYSYETKWFNQTVDHFSFTNSDRFQQRYLINDTWWNSTGSGPIFFYTGNEGDIESFAQNSGFIWDIAPEFEALVIFAEHRYYGQSLPYGPKSLTNASRYVGFLSSEQALADYAELLLDLKSVLSGAASSPVIAFGGSYGGMLAAWFRIKFPHVCDGAIAASAPIHQFSAPCEAFARVVTSDYTVVNSDCSDFIRRSWKSIDQLAKTSDGQKWLSSNWSLCTPITGPEGGQALKDYLNELWINVAMMNYPYPTNFLAPLPGNPVQAVCHAMMRVSPDDAHKDPKALLHGLFRGASVYFNYTGSAKCLNVSQTDDIGADMWDYQTCTEMVMPMCSSGVYDMFEPVDWNFTEYSAGCKRRWGFEPRQDMAKNMYGELKLFGASNIVFTNGLLDPWSSGGALRSITDSVIALLIPEGAHHLDLRGSNAADPTSVISCRKIERAHIRKWIKQAKNAHFGPLLPP